MSTYQFLTYETMDDGAIARILLNRPDVRNAQNRGLLVELDEAFLAAEADDAVRVVILGVACNDVLRRARTGARRSPSRSELEAIRPTG